MTSCQTPGMCSPHGGCQPPETASAFRSLLAERNSLAFLLKRFVDGEHNQDENQAERHAYHDEAKNLLAYLGGEVQGHTLVPDEAMRNMTIENARLRQIISDCATSCGAAVSVKCSLEFMAFLPSEVASVVTGARSQRDQLKAFATEVINASFEGGSFEGGDIQDIALKHGLLRVEQREDECDEACACREYGFPAECYRKTPILGIGQEEVATPPKDNENVSRHERR